MTDSDRTRLICPLTAGDPASMRRQMHAAARAGADAVELRLDFLDPPPSPRQLADLLADAPLDVLATCRPANQGGRFAGDERARLAILRQAAEAGAEWIDVERGVPDEPWPATVVRSCHDFDRCPDDLEAIAAELDASADPVNKLAVAAAGPQDALRVLDLLRTCRKPTIALAMGEAGVGSRVLAKKIGAFGTFAALAAGAESAPGQPTLEDFRTLYRWDAIGQNSAVFGVIGCPVGHSMSPAIHNAAFAAAGVDGVYLPLLVQPGWESFRALLDAIRRRPWLNWRGLSVTIPHKENALRYVGEADTEPLARRIGAVNTIAFGPDGSMKGYNTDYAAAIDALVSAMGIPREGLAGRSVAVLGAGGAARAIVAALNHYGAKTVIYNRTVARGEELAREFSADARGLDRLADLDAEIVINCTPLGMHPKVEGTPLERIPPSVRVVFDTIYNPIRTRLLAQAEKAGLLTADGLEMFVRQAARQFEIWTDLPAPQPVMRQVVRRRLGADP